MYSLIPQIFEERIFISQVQWQSLENNGEQNWHSPCSGSIYKLFHFQLHIHTCHPVCKEQVLDLQPAP